jgi:hypothetical protein
LAGYPVFKENGHGLEEFFAEGHSSGKRGPGAIFARSGSNDERTLGGFQTTIPAFVFTTAPRGLA